MNRKWQATKRNSAKCGKVWFTNVRHFILCFYFTCLSSCVVLCTLFIMPSSHTFFPAHLKRRFIYGCPLSTSFHHFSAVDICLFSTIRVCTTLVTRNVANRQRFSSRSSYLKLQIRSVYFVTQQFSSLKRKRRRNTETKRINKKHIPNVVVVTWSRVLNILRCGGWKPKTEKCTKKHRAENKSARIVFQFVPSTIKIVGFIVSHLVFHIERQHVSWCIVRGASNSYPFSLKIAAVLYSWMAHKGAI